jgi:hypothetical protein
MSAFQPLRAIDLGFIDTLIMAHGGKRYWWQAGLVQALIQRGWTLPRNSIATSAGTAIATSLLTGTAEAALVSDVAVALPRTTTSGSTPNTP